MEELVPREYTTLFLCWRVPTVIENTKKIKGENDKNNFFIKKITLRRRHLLIVLTILSVIRDFPIDWR
jgi:hypothetical protein